MGNAISVNDRILDISVNLARMSEFILDEKRSRLVDLFLNQTKEYIDIVAKETISVRFKPTMSQFRNEFKKLLSDRHQNDKQEWAERALTWANILQHRAKLA